MIRSWGLRAALAALVGMACAPAAAPEREIEIAMVDYAFLPTVVVVRPGERVRLTVRNIARQGHDLRPDQRGTALGLVHLHAPAGATGHQDWTAPEAPAEIALICTVPGHQALGMTGRLVVADRAVGLGTAP